MKMNAIERHRKIWEGKSDEWLFERLDSELKDKVEEIHRLLAENEALRKQPVNSSISMQDLMLYYQDSKNFDFNSKVIDVLSSMENNAQSKPL